MVFDEKANTWKQEDGGVSNRRAGYDFCFSVPKSVSLYPVETGDRAVEQLIHGSFEAAFHAPLAEKLLENGFAIRRTDRDYVRDGALVTNRLLARLDMEDE